LRCPLPSPSVELHPLCLYHTPFNENNRFMSLQESAAFVPAEEGMGIQNEFAPIRESGRPTQSLFFLYGLSMDHPLCSITGFPNTPREEGRCLGFGVPGIAGFPPMRLVLDISNTSPPFSPHCVVRQLKSDGRAPPFNPNPVCDPPSLQPSLVSFLEKQYVSLPFPSTFSPFPVPLPPARSRHLR